MKPHQDILKASEIQTIQPLLENTRRRDILGKGIAALAVGAACLRPQNTEAAIIMQNDGVTVDNWTDLLSAIGNTNYNHIYVKGTVAAPIGGTAVSITRSDVTVEGLAGNLLLPPGGSRAFYIDNAHNVTIKNLNIECSPRSGHGRCGGIFFGLGSVNPTIIGNVINGAGGGDWTFAGICGGLTYSAIVSQNRITNSTGKSGIIFDSGASPFPENILISENFISSATYVSGGAEGNGIYMKSFANVIISNNIIEGADRNGIELKSCAEATVIGNRIKDIGSGDNDGGIGISFGNCPDSTCSSNYVYDIYSIGIEVIGDNITVNDNYVEKIDGHATAIGISIDNDTDAPAVARAMVANNTVVNARGFGMQIYKAIENAVIIGNHFVAAIPIGQEKCPYGILVNAAVAPIKSVVIKSNVFRGQFQGAIHNHQGTRTCIHENVQYAQLHANETSMSNWFIIQDGSGGSCYNDYSATLITATGNLSHGNNLKVNL